MQKPCVLGASVERYRVLIGDFFDRRADGIDNAFGRLIATCEEPIKQLIARYDLAEKSVLSIGAGEGFEEVWFARAGCPLTLVDINPSIGAFCASLPPAAGEPGAFTYVIADAEDYVATATNLFDVLYVSSFHPDELRREELQGPAGRWPAGEDPYHLALMRAASLLKPGGLAIFQHYRGGVNIAVQPNYLDDVRRQFRRHGLAPLEAYTFRSSPKYLLLVAVKGRHDDAAALGRSFQRRSSISEFHGRFPGPERKRAMRIYSAAGLAVSQSAELAAWQTSTRILATLRRAKYQITRRIKGNVIAGERIE
jgi:SAM-dependent methyltransferase